MGLKQAFLALVGGNVFVTAANLLRDIVLASAFGAALESDIFFLAISIPVFILTVAANAFRSVVVPPLSRFLGVDSAAFHAIAARFAMIAGVGVLIVACGLLAIAGGAYVADVPGVSTQTRRQFALFLAAILPMYAGTSLIELLQGPLQVTGRFFLPSLLKLGLPLGIIVGVLAFSHMSIFAVSAGGALGVAVALPICVYLLRRDRMLPAGPTVPLPDDVRRTAVVGYQSLVAATLIQYANPLVDQWMAGFAGQGATSMLGYASRLMTGVAGLVATAVSQVLLIHFSRAAGSDDRKGITGAYRFLVQVMPWVGCVATLAVWLTSGVIVSILYQRGKFGADDARVVADLVNGYALQLPFYWTGIAPVTLAWALSMNRIFVRIGVILFLANVIGDLAFLELFGVRGIPFSTTLVLIISITMVSRALHSEGRMEIPSSDWVRALLPLAVLGACWALIRRFDIELSIAFRPVDARWAVLLLAGFCAVALAMSVRAFRAYQAVVAR